MGFIEALTLIFVVCKLFEVIDWSWWWVLSPLWGTYGAVIICVILFQRKGLYWLMGRRK